MNIPYKLQHIWIGPLPAPLSWMNTWQTLHPNWEYSIFDNMALQTTNFYNQHLIDEYLKRKKYSGAADLIRYELLYKNGGFIPEADSVCLNNTEELFTSSKDYCYTVYENEIVRPNYVSPIYACNPNNNFLKIIIETLHSLSPKELNSKPFISTGNFFLKNMIEKYDPKIKIFPSHYFIPHHFKNKNKRYNGPDKIYADQKWGSTRHTYDQGI